MLRTGRLLLLGYMLALGPMWKVVHSGLERTRDLHVEKHEL